MQESNEALRHSLTLDYDSARSMPAEFYTSEELLEVEKVKLFTSQWLCLGRIQQIPKPGDYYATEVMGEPLIVVRTNMQTISVLSNVCRHRGSILVRDSGNTDTFTCPYHSWSYNIDGSLRRAPLIIDRPDFEPKKCRLPAFSSEVWGGFIYVNLDGTAPTLASQLEGLSNLIKNYHMADMVELHSEESIWETNWKCLTENFMEGYHLSTVHRKTLHPITPTHLCEHFPAGQGYFGYFSVFPDDLRQRGKYHPDLTTKECQRSVMFAIPPGHVAGVAGHKVTYLYLQPDTVDTVRVKRGIAFADPAISNDSLGEAVDLFEQTMAEDKIQLANLRRGLHSRSVATAPLAPANFEGNVLDFYQYMARHIL